MLSAVNIVELLTKGLSKETAVMLHGTSIETAFILFETGTLPTGRPYKSLRNHLFFAPIGEKLRGHKYYRRYRKWTFEDALDEAKGYAKMHGTHQCISNALMTEGVDARYVDKIVLAWEEGFSTKGIPREGVRKAEALEEDWWDKTRAEAYKRKGVVIAANEAILNLKFSIEPEAIGDLRVHCPTGLNASYIYGVKPIGQREKKLLEDYLSKREF